jgi:hypothetical protein
MFLQRKSLQIVIVALTVLALVAPATPVLAARVANDDFSDAIVVRSLPFTDRRNTRSATAAGDDPTDFVNSGSVWYAFRPRADTLVEVNTFGSNYDTTLAVYTGRRGSLTLLPGAANDDYEDLQSRVAFRAVVGETYYVMAAMCCGIGGSGGGDLVLTMNALTPVPPNVDIDYEPYQPSQYDTILFIRAAYDPIGVGFAGYTWDFGDGTTATGQTAEHRYPTDGDRQVTLTATTYDGRSASVTRTIAVQTHDVAITKFTRPRDARVGLTRKIVVRLTNTRYPDYVRVELQKSTPTGWVYFGNLEQWVPVRGANRTTDFYFSYTFTPDDGQVGKVSFRAVAWNLTWRDAISADNEFISYPIRVRGGAVTAADETIDTTYETDLESYKPGDEAGAQEEMLGESLFLPLVSR